MPVQPITSLKEFRKIIDSPTPVIVDFWAVTCGNCKAIAPFYESLSESSSSSPNPIPFYKVDIDDQPDISDELGIQSMPTFMVFKNGNKITELVGAYPPRLQKLVEKFTE